MNDPAVIEWLESEEGNEWRKENLAMKNLLLVTVKEDYDSPYVPNDIRVATFGWIPDGEDETFMIGCGTGAVPVPDEEED
jgi:hypothetical protein